MSASLDETAIIRLITRGVVALLVFAVLAYPLDWLVWEARMAAGHGMGTVSLQSITTASLKGNRQAYYVDGTVDSPCSRSLFPQAGAGACWWLQRHREQVQNY